MAPIETGAEKPEPHREVGVAQVPWWWALSAGLLSGSLMVLAFAPFNLWPLTVLTPVPLVLLADRMARETAPPRRMRTLLRPVMVWLGVMPCWLYESRWLIDVTEVGYPLLAGYLACFAPVFVWLLARVWRLHPRVPGIVVAAVLWGTLEVFRGEVGFTGYAWYFIGHPLIEFYPLAAPASVVGAYGVSILVAALAGLIADLFRGWQSLTRCCITGGLLAVGCGLLAGVARWTDSTPKETTIAQVAVVQTNVRQDNKLGWDYDTRLKDFARFIELSRQAAAANSPLPPDLIIWPETMFPTEGFDDESLGVYRREQLVLTDRKGGSPPMLLTRLADELLAVQPELKAPLMVGCITMSGLRVERTAAGLVLKQLRKYNSAVVIDQGRIQPDRYDKRRLTPFGEVIPYVWRWPELQQWVLGVGAGGVEFDLSPGNSPPVLTIPLRPFPGLSRPQSIPVAVPICFEATKSDLCRELAYDHGTPRALMLINLSNDGWFSSWRGGREQHLQASRWRCVELGLPMVRAVNAGVSAVIGRRGQILAYGPAGQAAVHSDGVMHASVPIFPGASGTIFGRIGDVPAWTCFAAGVLLFLYAVIRRPGMPQASEAAAADRKVSRG